MTIDDVLEWIAQKNAEIFCDMHNNGRNDENWERKKAAFNILEKLRHHILMKTNPHNREDIRKVNEREVADSK